MDSESPGKVWLVGAGPGDPDLITLRGRRALGGAEVVLYDALSHPDLLQYAPASAELRAVGKRGGSRSPEQTWITEQLIQLARAGRRVVRLKGGDPSLFARGAEEALALRRAEVDFEIVPGVASPIAAAAFAGVPLTHRDLSSSVTFITGSDRRGKAWSPEAWKRLATATDTICVLMGMRNLGAITQALVAGGRSATTPAAVVQWAGRPEQRTVVSTLGSIEQTVARAGIENPALLLVGHVVGLRSELSWFESRPLFGKRLAIPRPIHQAEATAWAVRERGAAPLIRPAIEIVAPPVPAQLAKAARGVRNYDMCVFTSSNAVSAFFSELRTAGLDSRAFGDCKLAAIGTRTAAALEPHGLRADLVAKEFVGEALADAILAYGVGQRVLLPRALVARPELPRRLRAAGLAVDEVPAYQTRPVGPDQAARLIRELEAGEVDGILFTSSSMVDSVVAMLGTRSAHVLGRTVVASIGPITTRTAEHHGIRVDVTAPIYTVAGLLDALEQRFTVG